MRMGQWMVCLEKPKRRVKKAKRHIKRTRRPRRESKRHRSVVMEDMVWRGIVKDAADGKCQRCGKRGEHAHHVRSKKAHPSLRHNPIAGLYLCAWCHSWAHMNPLSFEEWFRATWPETAQALWSRQ